jgi:phenylacetate-CoA ligase
MVTMKTKNKQQHSSFNYIFPLSVYTFYHTFSKWYKFLEKSQICDKQRIEKYQTNQLKSLISQSYNNVPYYHSIFKSKKIKPSEIQSLADIGKIPFLTKDDIKQYQSQLQAKNYPNIAFHQLQTGGTTGSPLIFYVEKTRWLGIHFAFNRFYMKKAGYQWFDKIVSFSGIPILKKYHPLYRTIELSSHYTNTSNYDHFNRLIHRFKPKYISAFPSAILLFTHDLIRQNRDLYTNIKAIFCHGEYLHQQEKKFLEEIYDCRVLDQYGHREQCVFASTSTNCDFYHVYPEYGIIELIDNHNRPIEKEGKIGEIVATSLINNVSPFIRYRTGDLAERLNEPCLCGRDTFTLKRIIGRSNEFLIGKKQEKIMFSDVHPLFMNPIFHIKEYQIIQENEGELIINFIKSNGFSDKDIGIIQKELKKILGLDFLVDFVAVESIQRSANGKFRFLIQKLPVFNY